MCKKIPSSFTRNALIADILQQLFQFFKIDFLLFSFVQWQVDPFRNSVNRF